MTYYVVTVASKFHGWPEKEFSRHRTMAAALRGAARAQQQHPAECCCDYVRNISVTRYVDKSVGGGEAVEVKPW